MDISLQPQKTKQQYSVQKNSRDKNYEIILFCDLIFTYPYMADILLIITDRANKCTENVQSHIAAFSNNEKISKKMSIRDKQYQKIKQKKGSTFQSVIPNNSNFNYSYN